jgi:hypothetical protein
MIWHWSYEHGVAEAKPLDARGDLADLPAGVRARVARIRSKRFDRERLDLHITPICSKRRSLTLGVSSSIAILRQHRMDPRLLNPKIARRGVVKIENGPQTWITQGFGCNGHPPVLAKRPITSMTGAKSDCCSPTGIPRDCGRLGHPPVLAARWDHIRDAVKSRIRETRPLPPTART